MEVETPRVAENTRPEWEEILEESRALARLCEEWLVFLGESLDAQRPRVALHDPLTVATLVDDSLCPFSSQRLRVDARGATHCESGAPNAQVATDVQVDTLRVHLMETWL